MEGNCNQNANYGWTAPQIPVRQKPQMMSQNVEMYSNPSTLQNYPILIAGSSPTNNTKYATVRFCCFTYPIPTCAKFVATLSLFFGIYNTVICVLTAGPRSIVYVLIFLAVTISLFYGVFKSLHAFTIPYIVFQVTSLTTVANVCQICSFLYPYECLTDDSVIGHQDDRSFIRFSCVVRPYLGSRLNDVD
ncbi:hypothetical protein AB6A40_006536 [Gnathostoma spinigerum]|uniref:Transmembrane protein n=1 Tax=Gnathostoma spinigerum TaxID=75299 RepID=A0ABD6EKU6_9BILA